MSYEKPQRQCMANVLPLFRLPSAPIARAVLRATTVATDRNYSWVFVDAEHGLITDGDYYEVFTFSPFCVSTVSPPPNKGFLIYYRKFTLIYGSLSADVTALYSDIGLIEPYSFLTLVHLEVLAHSSAFHGAKSG